MEQATKDELQAIVDQETWTAEDHEQLRRLLSAGNAPASLRVVLAEMEAQTPNATGAAALKIGMARYMLCRFDSALEALAAAADNKDSHYFQGLCHKNLRHYEQAAKELARSLEQGADEVKVSIELVEVQALSGDRAGARKALAKLEKKIGQSADYFYLSGLIEELDGNTDQAGEAYEEACRIDPAHSRAAFRLAYHCDLHGDEHRAIELYQLCLKHPPVRANALLNLAVLYEDAGRYDQAATCLRNILATNPQHQRARLFLRDVQASKNMYYDEDRARRIAKRNAVLDIPVTDFELSVRARNCLKKMNLHTLGDLVNISEAELLSYKNFGETSLKEIKDMLTAKNLHLGQALEEDSDFQAEPRIAPAEPNASDGVLATPLEQVEFSVRARRALESLKIATVGELVSKSEAELMSCRNFGQTSLNEVRQRLSEFGLQLRETS